MQLSKFLFKLFMFVAFNAAMCLGHIEIFQSGMPKLSWATAAVHAIILIFFPYPKFFNLKNKQSNNESI